jgi:hypothetical protein
VRVCVIFAMLQTIVRCRRTGENIRIGKHRFARCIAAPSANCCKLLQRRRVCCKGPATRWHFCTPCALDLHRKRAKTKMEDRVWIEYYREMRDLSLSRNTIVHQNRDTHSTGDLSGSVGVTVCVIGVRVRMAGMNG